MAVRIRLGAQGEFLLVLSEDLITNVSEPDAAAWLRRSGAVQDDPEALAELASGLSSGELVAVRIDSHARRLDAPKTISLTDLVPDDDRPPRAIDDRPTEQTWFELQLVGPSGAPLSGVEVQLVNQDLHPTLTTDDDGRALLDPGFGDSASVSIKPTEALTNAIADDIADHLAGGQPWLTDDDAHIVHYRGDVLGPIRLSPEQPLVVSLQPLVVLGRLGGMLFDTDRDFLLPQSREPLADLRALYERCQPGRVVVVGHTDTSGDPGHNQALSLRRAQTVRAFLLDDVDAWLDRFGSGSDDWGSAEDEQMLDALPDADTRPPGQSRVKWFQQTRGLVDDGVAGPVTRRALIEETMAFDGTTLPDDAELEVLGCGEDHPLAASGDELDEAPVDGADDPIDRRVELLFFAEPFAVTPAVDDDDAYPAWRMQARDTVTRVVGAKALEIALIDGDEHPIGGARYVVRLASGGEIEGVLDEQGVARIERLPQGAVRVDFPEHAHGFELAELGVLEGGQ